MPGSGRLAVTWNPPSASGRALNLPPHRWARSRMPMIPCPAVAGGSLGTRQPPTVPCPLRAGSARGAAPAGRVHAHHGRDLVVGGLAGLVLRGRPPLDPPYLGSVVDEPPSSVTLMASTPSS